MSTTRKRLARIGALLAAFALLATACGGSTATTTTTEAATDPGGTDKDTTTTTEAAPETTTTTEAAGDPLIEAKAAVVRIEAEGSFVDPEYGEQLNAAGSGTGFIISEDGIAVTNNHVVTGAALLRVYINDEDTPRNARILGVSECSDLAVIDIEGDGFQALEWRSDPIDAGLSIFALGFPLGNTEYTVLDGVVSKASAGGESSWASVDAVIEHSADTLPGNSGGPIVDENGQVVAVNYAGDSNNQSFAIAGSIAQQVVDVLASGADEEGIGINGQAVASDDGTISGVWVASVASGSPADRVGVVAGDLITKLEGLVLATDRSMADYCDILRTKNEGDAISIEVLRFDTGEILNGTLNDPEGALVVGNVFGVDTETEDPPPDDGTGETYTYTTIEDSSGTLSVSVPDTWDDINGNTWTRDEEDLGVGISASTDRDAWLDSWDVPGLFLGASKILWDEYGSAAAYLDSFGDGGFLATDCDAEERDTYDDGLYEGDFIFYTGCNDVDAFYVRLIVQPLENPDQLIRFEFQGLTALDDEALGEAVTSFLSTGEFEL